MLECSRRTSLRSANELSLLDWVWHPNQHKCCRCTDQLKLNSDCEMGYFGDGLGCFGDGYLADRRFEIAFKRHCEYATTRANSFGNFLQFLPWHKSTSLNCYGMAGMLIVPISMCLSKSPVNLKAMTRAFKFGARSTSINRAPVLEIAWTQALYTDIYESNPTSLQMILLLRP